MTGGGGGGSGRRTKKTKTGRSCIETLLLLIHIAATYDLIIQLSLWRVLLTLRLSQLRMQYWSALVTMPHR